MVFNSGKTLEYVGFLFLRVFCTGRHFDRVLRKNDRHMWIVSDKLFLYIFFFLLENFFSGISKFVFYANRGKQNNASAKKFTAEEDEIQLCTRVFFTRHTTMRKYKFFGLCSYR